MGHHLLTLCGTRRARLLALPVLVLVAGCDFMGLDKLVFFPDPWVPEPPPGVEERWITTEDGVRLHAWFAGVPGAPATLIWSHGNGGNIGGRGDVLLALASEGVSVLAYDYRGYGRSEGSPSEAGDSIPFMPSWPGWFVGNPWRLPAGLGNVQCLRTKD